MLTRMAPEFAAGEHFRFVRELASKTMMLLLNDELVMNLSESDRAAIIQEFGRARRHIIFNLQLKMSFWLSPPWSHMALGHPDEDVARGEARRSLQRFHAEPPEADHHAVTLELCSPGGRGYDEMSRFAAGAVSREQCPTIIYYAAIFRFATVSERWIEGRHAQAKSGLRSARCAGIVHIAFTGSFTRIKKLVMSPGSVDKFAELCLEVRRPKLAIYASGLNKHPAFVCIEQEVSKVWKLNEVFRTMLVEILFHIDSFTLFQKVGGHDAGDGGGGKQVRPTRKNNSHGEAGGEQVAAGSSLKQPDAPEVFQIQDNSHGEAGGEAEYSPTSPAKSPQRDPALEGLLIQDNSHGVAGGELHDSPTSPAKSPQRDPTLDVDACVEIAAGTSSAMPSAINSDQSSLHNRLWCKSALAFIRLLHKHDEDREYVWSIGPKLSEAPSLFFTPFSDFVGSWESALSVGAGGGFVFEDASGGLASSVESLVDSYERSEPMSTIWFRIVDDKPANRPVPHRAKKVEDPGFIAVQSVDIKYFNQQTKNILASLERNDGTAQTDFDIFGPSCLSVSDINTLRF